MSADERLVRFVLFQKLLSIMALVVLSVALYRVFQNFRVSHHSAAQNVQRNGLNSQFFGHASVRWFKHDHLLLPLSSLKDLAKKPERGGELLIFQESSGRHRCLVGVFALVENKEKGILLKGLSYQKHSNMLIWAKLNHQELRWRVELPDRSDAPIPFVQMCEKWILTKAEEKYLFLLVKNKETFLKAKQFSDVKSLKSERGLSVIPDLIRGGWRVNAESGIHELLVQSARTGLKHRLLVQFLSKQSNNSTQHGKKKTRHLAKPVLIPGWD